MTIDKTLTDAEKLKNAWLEINEILAKYDVEFMFDGDENVDMYLAISTEDFTPPSLRSVN